MQIEFIVPGLLAIISAAVNLLIVYNQYKRNKWKTLIYIQIALLFILIWASLLLSQLFITNIRLSILAGHLAIIYLFGMMYVVHRANFLIFYNVTNTKLQIYDIIFSIYWGFTVTLSFQPANLQIAITPSGTITHLSLFFGSAAIFLSVLSGGSIFFLIMRVARLSKIYGIKNSNGRLYAPFLLLFGLLTLLIAWQNSTAWQTPQLHVFLYFSVLVSFVIDYTYGIKPVSYVFHPYALHHILLVKPQGIIAYSKSFIDEHESMVHLFSSGIKVVNIYLNISIAKAYPSNIQTISFKKRQILVKDFSGFSLVFITQKISFQLQELFETIYKQIFLAIDLPAISQSLLYDSEVAGIIDDIIKNSLGG